MTKMNLSAIKPVTAKVEITHPGTGEGLGIVFDQVSRSDARVKAVDQKLRDMLLQQRQRNKVVTAAQLDENATRLIIASLVGWDWAKAKVEWSGNKEFTEANLRQFFEENPWARDQLDENLGDDARFFPN